MLVARVRQDEALWFYWGFPVAQTKEEQAHEIMHPLFHYSQHQALGGYQHLNISAEHLQRII